MTLYKRIVAIGIALAPAEALCQAPGDSFVYEGMRDQFVIALPRGWTVYDQGAFMTHNQGPFGMVIFSSVDMAQLQAEQRIDDFRKVASGETPAFFVDRSPAWLETQCAAFPKKAQKQVIRIVENTLYKKGSKKVEPISTEAVLVGGCQGLHLRGRALHADGKGWTIDVRAVSDGKVGYLFTLRNTSGFFEGNREPFDRAMSSLRLSVAK